MPAGNTRRRFRPIRYDALKNTITILDQTRLPGEEKYVDLKNSADVCQALKTLAVRGAPLIGVCAAYALVQCSAREKNIGALEKTAARINACRPTAVNLSRALDRMTATLRRSRPGRAYRDLLREARRIEREDRLACRRIGAAGAGLVRNGSRVMVYCNAGMLATCGIGTALGVLYAAKAQGKKFQVYACETRPLLQGSRLTAWELARAGIATGCVCDNMAAALMPDIDLVLVGADRIAANGDTANKIGTRGLAIIARYHGVEFYVAAPSSTFDRSRNDGSTIPIEERSAAEIGIVGGKRITAVRSGARNPAFDVTPARLITGFITEFGIIRPPFGKNIGRILINR